MYNSTNTNVSVELQGSRICFYFSIEYMKKTVEFYDAKNAKTGKKQHSWEAFQHYFRNVKDRNYIESFRKYLESDGTKPQKLDEIDQYTYENFEKARAEHLIVHDIHLKRWALQKAREIDDNTFKASDNWVLRFKRRHALCSRKITKLVTQREVIDADIINSSANNFVSKIKLGNNTKVKHAKLNQFNHKTLFSGALQPTLLSLFIETCVSAL